MKDTYDIIIIGADINGLVAACSLAKSQKSVLVIEPRSFIGGLAAPVRLSDDIGTHGFLHDTSVFRKSTAENLGLEKHGLEFDKSRSTISLLSDNGRQYELSGDLNTAIAAISTWSEKDAIAYKEYQDFVNTLRPFIVSIFSDVPPDILNPGGVELLSLAKKMIGLKRLGKQTMTEFLKVAPMSVKDFLDERFESAELKSILAMQGLKGDFTSPMSSYTTLNLLIWECMAQRSVKGGAPALLNALMGLASSLGIEVKTESPIKELIVKAGSVDGVMMADGTTLQSNAVFSSHSPRITFYDWILPNKLPAKLESDVKHFRSEGYIAQLNLALSDMPERFEGTEMKNHSFLICGSMTDIEKSFDPSKYKRFSNLPVMEFQLNANDHSEEASGSLAATVTIHFVPYHLDGGWTATSKENLYDSVISRLSDHMGDLSKKIVAHHLMTPPEIESYFGKTGGHIYDGDIAIDQLFTRPFPSCARYATPIKGLWLCGDSSFSGGSMSGMPGLLAARAFNKS